MIHFVGAGPGDPELLTCKAERILYSCQVCIWAGSLVNPEILDVLDPRCRVVDSSSLDLEATTHLMVQAHREGLDVVRLHTGDPSLFGAIAEQIRALDQEGIPWEIVPGVSSFQAAAAALGVELTAPEVSQAVVLCRSPGRTPVPEGQKPSDFAASNATLCLFLSASSLESELRDIAKSRGEHGPAAAVWRASWPDQVVVRGTLGNLAAKVREAGFDRQILVVVGEALSGLGGRSRLYDPEFSHGWRSARVTGEGD
ncbi:MAG TPA: precorrin-4 C(11)-methyltransferase [Fibrobacteria bacterium]|nr:precorrin-4 C(11)-methyltransferase [Fibrobacteria bacterium]